MKIEHLREFVACAEEGGFSGAARKLFVTQPAISKHIASLEDELGVSLLDRNTHSTSLTPIGSVAYELFSITLRDFDHAMETIDILKAGYSREIRLGFLLHGLNERLYRGASAIADSSDHCRIIFEFKDASDLITQLQEGSLDACLLLEISCLQTNKIFYQNIKRVPLFALVLEDDPLAQCKTLTLEHLTDRTLIIPQNEGGYAEGIARIFEEHGLAKPKMRYTLQKGTQLFTMRENHDIAIISEISKETDRTGVVAIPFADKDVALNFGWIYREDEDRLGSVNMAQFLKRATDILYDSGAI